MRRVTNREDAADLVSETLMTAWKISRRAPTEPAAARMWLFGVARNLLRHHLRSSRRRDALTQRLAATVVVHHYNDDDRHDVRLAVDALPPDLGELIRLVHWDGFTLDDAAAHLGINSSTARSRHARAKQLLREALCPTLTGPPADNHHISQRRATQ